MSGSGLQREDEVRLAALRQRAETGEPPLSESEELWLSVLEDRYSRFLEEGIRVMQRSVPKHARTSSFPGSSPLEESRTPPSATGFKGFLAKMTSSTNSSKVNPTSSPSAFDSPLTPTSVAQQDSTTQVCKHWTWVTDFLIVGAVPLASRAPPDNSAHLSLLKEQCEKRRTQLGLVVSAIDYDELMQRPNDNVADFSTPREWATHLPVQSFATLPLPEDPCAEISVPLQEVEAVCASIHETITSSKQAVFIHCKSGRRRCWCVLMAYLLSYRNMTFAEGRGLLATLRPSFDQSAQQQQWVEAFAARIAEKRQAKAVAKEQHQHSAAAARKRSGSGRKDEERYMRVLGDALALPIEYRQRLIKELNQLA